MSADDVGSADHSEARQEPDEDELHECRFCGELTPTATLHYQSECDEIPRWVEPHESI